MSPLCAKPYKALCSAFCLLRAKAKVLTVACKALQSLTLAYFTLSPCTFPSVSRLTWFHIHRPPRCLYSKLGVSLRLGLCPALPSGWHTLSCPEGSRIHFLDSFRFLHRSYLSREVFLITLIDLAIPSFPSFPTLYIPSPSCFIFPYSPHHHLNSSMYLLLSLFV